MHVGRHERLRSSDYYYLDERIQCEQQRWQYSFDEGPCDLEDEPPDTTRASGAGGDGGASGAGGVFGASDAGGAGGAP